jgi:hypothetical protein
MTTTSSEADTEAEEALAAITGIAKCVICDHEARYSGLEKYPFLCWKASCVQWAYKRGIITYDKAIHRKITDYLA